MRQFELLKVIVTLLNENQVEYMMTGSIVSSIQGEPRSTHDIDIIIHINNKDKLKFLFDQFKNPVYYIDEETIDNAVKSQTMFNLIDTADGEKIDFWILTESDFDKSRFGRRIFEKIDDFGLFISAPEDTIIAKLLWCGNSGGSRKHFIDALRIYEMQKDLLDIEYLKLWSKKLGITDLLEEMIK